MKGFIYHRYASRSHSLRETWSFSVTLDTPGYTRRWLCSYSYSHGNMSNSISQSRRRRW